MQVYEAFYHDSEYASYRGGWEVILWTAYPDGSRKGKSISKFYYNESDCIKEALRLNVENGLI